MQNYQKRKMKWVRRNMKSLQKELKKLTNAKLAYGDSNGNIDYDGLSPAKRRNEKGKYGPSTIL